MIFIELLRHFSCLDSRLMSAWPRNRPLRMNEASKGKNSFNWQHKATSKISYSIVFSIRLLARWEHFPSIASHRTTPWPIDMFTNSEFHSGGMHDGVPKPQSDALMQALSRDQSFLLLHSRDMALGNALSNVAHCLMLCQYSNIKPCLQEAKQTRKLYYPTLQATSQSLEEIGSYSNNPYLLDTCLTLHRSFSIYSFDLDTSI